MQLRRVEIIKYRNFENVIIDFEKSDFPNVFSIASKNGGGKSTLLQFIFIVLHCFNDEKRKIYLQNLLHNYDEDIPFYETAKFIIEDKGKEYYLNITFHMTNHFDFEFETDMTDEEQVKLSNSIYLILPEAQPLHFLSEDTNIEDMKKELANFSTYDFPTEKSILQAFDHAKEEDVKQMRQTGQYGTHYSNFSNELKDFIENKEIGENRDGTKIVFKIKGSSQELLTSNLSHGEFRKLGIYIWLKSMVKKDSIILMDEVDIALHPSWQYELVEDLTKWSKGSQFLLATHSPQILSSTYYKNLIILKDNKVKQLSKPLRDNDINHIVELVMGASPLPMELDKNHKLYRVLVEEGKEHSEEAKKIKDMILEQEGIGSSFFRRIEFYKKMNK